MNFTQEELRRYKRQIVLDNVGISGQAKLKNAKILIVGLGGLGSPSALYLAAAGVGTLGLVDDDQVDLSNLQRQIIHNSSNIGTAKIDSAKSTLNKLNPNTKLNLYKQRLDESCINIIKNYDLILDGSDNFYSRYLVNDACVIWQKPFIHASIFQFSGQVALFNSNQNQPCYRCLYPNTPAPNFIPNCAASGVFGSLTGIIGSLQATEALKYILGLSQNQKPHLLSFNAFDNTFKRFGLVKEKNCTVCSENAKIKSIKDSVNSLLLYKNHHCDIMKNGAIMEISVQEYSSNKQKYKLIDVRRDEEYRLVNIGGTLIPLDTLESSLDQLNKDDHIAILCRSGQRSLAAAKLLQDHGFDKAVSIQGGINAYADEIDQSLTKY